MATEPLQIIIDRLSPVPLYHQVSSTIERYIDSGDLPPGTVLENETALAERLGISRPTARQALQQLVQTGRLVRRRGVGTRVAPEQVRRSMGLTSLHADLVRTGRRPSTRVLDYDTIPADRTVATVLQVKEGAPVIRLRRLRLADGEPLALMANVLRADGAPSRAELTTSGLYEALRLRGLAPKVAQQRVGARSATREEAELLNEAPGAALLTMERTAYDDAGTALEHGRHIYRSSRYIFDSTVSIG